MRSNKKGRENEDGETRRNVTNEDPEAFAFHMCPVLTALCVFTLETGFKNVDQLCAMNVNSKGQVHVCGKIFHYFGDRRWR